MSATVIRWKFYGRTGAMEKHGTIADVRPEPIGQTIDDAWAWFDRMLASADYTDLRAVAVMDDGTRQRCVRAEMPAS